MSELVSLTDVCDFQGGTQPPKSEWSMEPRDGYVRMLQIRDFTQGKSQHIEYVKDNGRLKKCIETDILIGRYGASIGKILTGLSGAYNVAMVKVIPDEKKISSEFLYFLLNGNDFQNFIINVGSRAAQAGFNKEDLARYKLKLPSLDEQKKISSVLLFVEKLLIKREKSLEMLDQMGRSIFLDIFGDPGKNPLRWPTKKMSELCRISSQIVDPKKKEYRGFYNIGSANIETGTGRLLNYRTVEEDNAISVKFHVSKEDVLYSKIRPKLKKVATVPDGNFLCSADIYPIRSIEGVTNQCFLKYFFLTDYFTEKSSIIAESRANIPKINREEIESMEIYSPPFDLQVKFTRIIEKIDSLIALNKSGKSRIVSLQTSLTNSFFNK